MSRLPFALLLSAASLCAAPAFAADCASLKSAALPNTTITTAERTQRKLVPPYGDSIDKLPAFCRVAGVLHPTPDSAIKFEVWMPEQGWNGRLLGTGNGGFAGTIYYGQMAAMLRRGYAVAGSDAGHEGDAEDAAFAYHHPEKIEDFGWRAVHLTAVHAKELLTAFYGHPQHKAYFDSCSDGGREALMESQRFPEDYDGILAGAPANNWAHMLTSGIDVLQTTLRDPAGYISSMKLPAITRAALAACDAQDGVKDGIISDPQSCHFDPSVLLCKDGDGLSCLTAPQVTTLKKLYSGGVDSHGQSIFPGFVPGYEAGSWKSWILGSGPGGGGGSNYASNYFRYMVADDATWSALTANVDDSLRMAVEKTSRALDSTNTDLGPFAARGGKLLVYHGWNDPAISPWNAINYWNSVQQQMGSDNASKFMQLYMVPGMEHCALGPGPSNFGQFGLPTAAGPGSGALDLLQLWVENGQQPQMILASKTIPAKAPAGKEAAPASIVRPLCPYPQQARYNGTGDPNRPTSFRCAN
jgi:feruloyl esterase